VPHSPFHLPPLQVASQRELHRAFSCLRAVYSARALVNVELSAGNINRRAQIFPGSHAMLARNGMATAASEISGEVCVNAAVKILRMR
jgi:hypothetical protein